MGSVVGRALEWREGRWAGECGRTSLYATYPDRQKLRGGGGKEREGMCSHSLAIPLIPCISRIYMSLGTCQPRFYTFALYIISDGEND